MTHLETIGCVITLAAQQFAIQPAEIDVDAPVGALAVDSLDYFEFLLEVERRFDVEIDYAEAARAPTIRRVAGLVHLALTDDAVRVI